MVDITHFETISVDIPHLTGEDPSSEAELHTLLGSSSTKMPREAGRPWDPWQLKLPLAHTHTYCPVTCAHILCPLPNKAMISNVSMQSHYLNLATLWAKKHQKPMICMLNHYLNLPPSGLQSNGLHAKSLFKSSPSARQSNDQHAKSLFEFSPLWPTKPWATC